MTQTWIPPDTFGARLALVRRELRMSIEEVAGLCGLSKASWARWERLGTSPRNMETVAHKIADKTGCDYRWLMSGGPANFAGFATAA